MLHLESYMLSGAQGTTQDISDPRIHIGPGHYAHFTQISISDNSGNPSDT